jgi:RHS repeat-associated protein
MTMPGRNWTAGTSYRYGFNGKENDNEVKGEGNQQDYGMRIYDPRLGRFLSVDPLTQSYPWYSPYQYAGDNPIKFVDLDGAEEHDNTIERYWKSQPLIDMTNAPVKNLNAAGVPRNALWFFKQQLAARPEMFSEAAKNSINKLNRVPVVDQQWVQFNPAHAEYLGQQLQHHHIDGGKMAVAIPKGLHYDKFSELHAYLKGGLNGAKITRGANGALNMLGGLSFITGALSGNPESWINAFGANGDPEDYVDKRVFKDWEANQYFEITSVTTTKEHTWKDGKIIKSRVTQRKVTADVFSDYIWDDESKRYKGVNKVGTKTEVWDYDKDGNRTTKDINDKLRA